MEVPREKRPLLNSPNGRVGRGFQQRLEEDVTEVLERITDSFFAVDREWRYTYLNQGALRHIQRLKGEGLTRGDLLGEVAWEVFPEQVGSVFYEKFHEALREQETVQFEAFLPPAEEWYGVHAYPSKEGLSVYFQDITARRQAEEKIRESEERFGAQYEGFPVPTISWRKIGDDFELDNYNSAADRFTQGRISGLVGLTASEWYSGDPRILEAFSRCHDEGVTIHQEKAWRMKTTGEHKRLSVTFSPVPPDLVMTHVVDITERKRVEEALEESNTLLRSIIEGTPDPIFLKDTRGRYLLANSAAAEVMGRSAEELLGKDNAELMPPELATKIMAADRRVMETDEPQTGEERIPVRGVTRTYLFTKAPYRNSQREVIGVIGIARDITERKQAEEELRLARDRFHSLVRHSSDIITTLAADGKTRYQSPAIERVLGYRPDELVGKSIFDYVHREDLDQVLSKLTYLLNNAETNPMVELRFRHKDGSWRYLEAIGSNLLHDPGIEGLVVNSRDITERRRLHEDQQRFLTNAAHQLKTPITTIVGAAELLVTKQDLSDAKKQQLLDHIFSEGRHMQRLSETLLRLAKVGLERRGPELESVDLAEEARQAARRTSPLAEGLGISLRAEGHSAYALADPGWLQEVLLILLENAAKHSGPAREIRLRAEENTICVEDDGTGMSSSELPHAFERFYRGKGSSEGFGLGLSIARELVERMGGNITLNSTEGSGTAARIELPGAGTIA